MSKWRTIPNEDIEIDGTDLNVLVDTDNCGNNYIILSLEYIKELLRAEEAEG